MKRMPSCSYTHSAVYAINEKRFSVYDKRCILNSISMYIYRYNVECVYNIIVYLQINYLYAVARYEFASTNCSTRSSHNCAHLLNTSNFIDSVTYCKTKRGNKRFLREKFTIATVLYDRNSISRTG